MKTFKEFIREQIESDPEFAEAYEYEKVKNQIIFMIVQARKSHNMTQGQLAEKVGTSQSAIARLEKGDDKINPSIDTLIRIARAFGMHLKLSFQ